MLIANKQDLYSSRVVDKNDEQNLINQLKLPFYETSAFMDENIQEVFKKMVHLMYKNL